MRSARGSGSIIAIVSAGPVFLVGIIVGRWATTAQLAIDPGAITNALAFIPIAAVTVLVGAVLATVPILLGTAAMRWAGGWNIAMRLPQMWMLAGGGIAGGAAMAADADAATAVAFAFTGAVCALIARAGVDWADDPSGRFHAVDAPPAMSKDAA